VRSADGVIKSNSTDQVIPSAEAIAAEVLKQQTLQLLEQHCTGLSIENWTAHTVETDMVRDDGLSYREIDGDQSCEIFCHVCDEYGRGITSEAVFQSEQRLKILRASIRRHLATNAHKKALTEKEKERKRSIRRIRVGLSIARTTMQLVREGGSYLQF
jgi:hypothetical protein